MKERISNLRLGEIELTLSKKERSILRSLLQFHFLNTDQLRRLFFSEGHTTLQASKTNTLKILHRLRRHGLINHLDQQYKLGCYGPKVYIWFLTEAGYRLLNLGTEQDGKRKRFSEASSTFLNHTIAVAECYIQFTEICQAEPTLSIRCLDIEPDCWRAFQKDGKAVSLRPDLYAETLCGEYRDRWFIEMDLDTEALPVVIEKCHRYQQYYMTNKEQTATGKFPVVLWIVPNSRRKESIIDQIKGTFGNRYVHMFLVITPDELHGVLLNGVKKEDLC